MTSNALAWTTDVEGCRAPSLMHDDGAPYWYTFRRTPAGWVNESDEELRLGAPLTFESAASAKAWAQWAESSWVRSMT